MNSTASFDDSADFEVTNSQLARAAQDGSRHGFELLVKRYQDRLFRSIFAIVSTAVIAEDITQCAFVCAFLNIASLAGNSQ